MGKSGYIQEKSLTAACVLRSKNIILAKAAIITNRQTQFICNRIPPIFPSSVHLKEIEQELVNRIDEYQRDIAKYLRKLILLNKKEINVPELKDISARFHLSGSDMKQGYLFLYTSTNTNRIDGVLILNDQTDLQMGKIYEFNEVKDKLHLLKNNTIKNCVAYTHAIKKIKDHGQPT